MSKCYLPTENPVFTQQLNFPLVHCRSHPWRDPSSLPLHCLSHCVTNKIMSSPDLFWCYHYHNHHLCTALAGTGHSRRFPMTTIHANIITVPALSIKSSMGNTVFWRSLTPQIKCLLQCSQYSAIKKSFTWSGADRLARMVFCSFGIHALKVLLMLKGLALVSFFFFLFNLRAIELIFSSEACINGSFLDKR